MYDDEEEASQTHSKRSDRSRSHSSASSRSPRNRSRSSSSRSSSGSRRDNEEVVLRELPKELTHSRGIKENMMKGSRSGDDFNMKLEHPHWDGIGFKLVAKVGSRYFSIMRGFDVEYSPQKPMQESATKCRKSGYFFCLSPEQAAKQPIVMKDVRVRHAPHVLLRCQCDGPFVMHSRGRFTCSRLTPLEEVPIPLEMRRHASSPTVGIHKLRRLIQKDGSIASPRETWGSRSLEGYANFRQCQGVVGFNDKASARKIDVDVAARDQDAMERDWLSPKNGTVIGFKLVARYKNKYFSLLDGYTTEFKLKEATESFMERDGLFVCRTPLKASTSYFPRIPIGFGRQQWRREYVITHEAGIPVNATRERSSPIISNLGAGTVVNVLEFAHEKLGGGRMRARIESPAGWITTRIADGSCHFAKLLEFERAVLKCACFGPFVRHSDDKVACAGIVPLEEVSIEQCRADFLRETFFNNLHRPVESLDTRNSDYSWSQKTIALQKTAHRQELHADVHSCFKDKVVIPSGTSTSAVKSTEGDSEFPSREKQLADDYGKVYGVDATANDQASYKIHDRVQCRDFGDQDWKAGIVTCVSPITVRPRGWASAKQWKEIRLIETAITK
mmetsp:Transcript_73627/g.115249  ORF Transcript_73627/g.115249 Transcript_73627/m.115249 type:complete len:616 (+) Transcript_73627:60-1907(+)